MGDIFLRAVVVFAGDEDYRTKAKTADRLEEFLAEHDADERNEWFNLRRCIIATGSCVNGTMTIVLAPSGSKIGWTEDNRWLELRDDFICWAETLPYADVLSIEDGYDGYPRWYLSDPEIASGLRRRD